MLCNLLSRQIVSPNLRDIHKQKCLSCPYASPNSPLPAGRGDGGLVGRGMDFPIQFGFLIVSFRYVVSFLAVHDIKSTMIRV